MDAMQAASIEGLSYDEESFSISIAEPPVKAFLGNAYSEYLAAPDQEKKDRVVHRFVTNLQAGLPTPPEDWEDVKHTVLPLLRDRTFVNGMNSRLFVESEKRIPWQVTAEFLALCVGHDTPTALNYVNHETLAKWNVRFEEALAQARDNLLAKSSEPFREIRPGLYCSVWSDCYDPARILIPEIFKALKLQGPPVVGVPHWNLLLVADSESPEAIIALAKVTEEEMAKPRNNNAGVLILLDGQWKPFLPPAGHPAYAALHRVAKIALLHTYGGEINDLTKHFAQIGKDIYVAPIHAYQHNDTLAITSHSQWSNGILTLLPKVDRLVLYDPKLPEKDRILGFVGWDELAAIVPELQQPIPDYFPPLYQVNRFPPPDELRRIKFTRK